MDVRCEKCQTEYELDEARLKPGGVTVKCTNCGHMFKIRKRAVTNVGAAAPAALAPMGPEHRSRPTSSRPVSSPPSALDEGPTSVDRQWLIRLENGEQKSCRELATLQQWIAGGLVTRESLISRTGKTWKRLGDIAELAQYFAVGDEARTIRSDRSARATSKASPSSPPPTASTLVGVAGGPHAVGGSILPDDDDEDEVRTTGNFKPRPATNAGAGAKAARTPPMGSNTSAAATARTEMFPPPAPMVPPAPVHAPPPVPVVHAPSAPVAAPPAPPVRRPITQPPPPPISSKRAGSEAGPQPSAIPAVPSGNRATAAWASDAVPQKGAGAGISGPSSGVPAGPTSGFFGGKLAAIPDEPAFAGRVRIAPGDDASFETGKVSSLDDDDDLLPGKRSSRTGTWVLVMALLVMGAAAVVVYLFVFKDKGNKVATATIDAPAVATATPDAGSAAPMSDAQVATPPSPLDAARGELRADVESRLRASAQSLEGSTDAPSTALRAHLLARLAQDLTDRASLTADKAEASKLRADSKQLALDAATAAQRALKAASDDPTANLAMAEVLRLQGKTAHDQQRYLDAARAKTDKADAAALREVALAEALTLARDNKLDDARTAFAAIDSGDGKLETSGDVRARFQQAVVLAAQNRTAEAKALNDQLLAAQPDHAGAKVLAAKLATTVAKTDPLPPEDHPATGSGGTVTPTPTPTPVETGGSYDSLLARANAAAETNCSKAMDLYNKALEAKPNGIEALSGMGYCHIDAKQFASAFSKFRAALSISPKFEPALWGIAEAYQQQGRKEQAIESYKAYLEAYPDSAKAKKQLQLLGVGGDEAPPKQPDPPKEPEGSAAAPVTSPSDVGN